MSDLLLPLALLSIFVAVALGSLSVATTRADKRKVLESLRTQLETSSVQSREIEMTKSLVSRLTDPMAGSLTGLARRFTPQDLRKRLAFKLALAGSPAGWDADKVVAAKVAGGAIGLVLGLVMAPSVGRLGILVTILLTVVGLFGPDAILSGRGEARQEEIRRSLPDTMDLLTISMEAGLSFNAALAHVMTHIPGALSEEIGRLLQEMRLGSSRMDAMRDMGKRTTVEEMKSFVLSMVQAETFGVSIANVLRAQAKELRVKRGQRAEERAMKIPVKILFPLIFCTMPALFVVIIGPGAIKIAEGIMGVDL